MTFDFNVYSLILILSGMLTLVLSGVVFRRLGGAVHSFGYVMLGIGVWAVAYGLELASGTLNQMLFWVNVEYLGIAFLPALWLVFILKFIGRERWLNPFGLFMIFKIPVATLLLAWTNPYHHWYYDNVTVDTSGPFPMLHLDVGIWYRIHTAFFYVTLALGIYFLVVTFRSADMVFKKQNRLILVSALIPWLVNLLYLLGLRPYANLDLTPFAFILTSSFIGIGLLRFGLFDIVPVARTKVVEAMQEGVLVVNNGCRIVDANNRMRQMLQGSRRIIGSHINDLGLFVERFEDLVAAGGETRKETKFNVDGRREYFAVTITPLYQRKTVYSGYILLFRNVTERKNYEESLDSLNKLKDRLFSLIAHDLRSPLNTLMGIISMSNEGYISPDELQELLPEISKNLGYTSGLVDNLLQWSKSQLAGEKMYPVDFDIHDTAEHIAELFRNTATSKQLEIRNEISIGTRIHADENMIQAVFRNLVSNAIKFSRPGGIITLSTSTGADFTTVCIRDNGVGIKEDDIPKLFGMENFSTRGTQDEKGTGLGLILCRDFVEKNGGLIWAESTVGEGSRFCFKLPVASS